MNGFCCAFASNELFMYVLYVVKKMKYLRLECEIVLCAFMPCDLYFSRRHRRAVVVVVSLLTGLTQDMTINSDLQQKVNYRQRCEESALIFSVCILLAWLGLALLYACNLRFSNWYFFKSVLSSFHRLIACEYNCGGGNLVKVSCFSSHRYLAHTFTC